VIEKTEIEMIKLPQKSAAIIEALNIIALEEETEYHEPMKVDVPPDFVGVPKTKVATFLEKKTAKDRHEERLAVFEFQSVMTKSSKPPSARPQLIGEQNKAKRDAANALRREQANSNDTVDFSSPAEKLYHAPDARMFAEENAAKREAQNALRREKALQKRKEKAAQEKLNELVTHDTTVDHKGTLSQNWLHHLNDSGVFTRAQYMNLRNQVASSLPRVQKRGLLAAFTMLLETFDTDEDGTDLGLISIHELHRALTFAGAHYTKEDLIPLFEFYPNRRVKVNELAIFFSLGNMYLFDLQGFIDTKKALGSALKPLGKA
jgi:hypothetical protein